ncbi:hypothetical protein [Knoellia koreensis]|uniref:Uncharacterized protein n=1 Tax=Knoellia koreensis TaxID=2730921 RepID=A0A849HE05_9MICO|nr:hypothetical protein [Knoellia sp. DB2414S]NNM45522.1 hypothetical protein [Knoellia sp. DB2414S]
MDAEIRSAATDSACEATLAARTQALFTEVRRLELLVEERRQRALDEARDVTRLERTSWTRGLASFRGRLSRDIERESAEASEASDALSDAEAKLSQLRRERDAVVAQAKQVQGASDRLGAAMEAKDAALRASGSSVGLRLAELAEQITRFTVELSRLDHVAALGEGADLDLGRALESARSTDVWASVDTVGGGLVASVAKFERLEGAERELASARASVDRFRRELRGSHVPRVPELSVGRTAKVVDILADNLLSDLAVQQKVRGVAAELENTRRQVQRALDDVRRKAADARARLAGLNEDRRALLMPE